MKAADLRDQTPDQLRDQLAALQKEADGATRKYLAHAERPARRGAGEDDPQ
jgi:hypothetical protein